jgi:hypothetical protein
MPAWVAVASLVDLVVPPFWHFGLKLRNFLGVWGWTTGGALTGGYYLDHTF